MDRRKLQRQSSENNEAKVPTKTVDNEGKELSFIGKETNVPEAHGSIEVESKQSNVIGKLNNAEDSKSILPEKFEVTEVKTTESNVAVNLIEAQFGQSKLQGNTEGARAMQETESNSIDYVDAQAIDSKLAKTSATLNSGIIENSKIKQAGNTGVETGNLLPSTGEVELVNESNVTEMNLKSNIHENEVPGNIHNEQEKESPSAPDKITAESANKFVELSSNLIEIAADSQDHKTEKVKPLGDVCIESPGNVVQTNDDMQPEKAIVALSEINIPDDKSLDNRAIRPGPISVSNEKVLRNIEPENGDSADKDQNFKRHTLDIENFHVDVKTTNNLVPFVSTNLVADEKNSNDTSASR